MRWHPCMHCWNCVAITTSLRGKKSRPRLQEPIIAAARTLNREEYVPLQKKGNYFCAAVVELICSLDLDLGKALEAWQPPRPLLRPQWLWRRSPCLAQVEGDQAISGPGGCAEWRRDVHEQDVRHRQQLLQELPSCFSRYVQHQAPDKLDACCF